MSALSPIERLRATYAARQRATTTEVDVYPDGSLVSKVGAVDEVGAKGLMLTIARLRSDEAGQLTNHDLADVIASSSRGLYSRGGDGRLEPLTSEDGVPITFETLGSTLGYPEVATAQGGVLIAFTEGDPPAVNSLRLMMVAMAVSGFLMEETDPGR